MPEKEVIKQLAVEQQHGLFVQWFIDWYGWAVVIIGGLISYIWKKLDGRVTTLEKKIDEMQSVETCEKVMDKVEGDCEKDTDILRADMKDLRADMKEGFKTLGKSITGTHERLDIVILKENKKRST